jgi:hypothetical protein
MAPGAGSVPRGLILSGIVRSPTDSEQLSQRPGVRARLVDLHGSGASDAFLGDQAAVGESIDLAHHGGRIHVERAGEIGQGASLAGVEEQLDQQTPLRVASKERGMVLHKTQYILRIAQNNPNPTPPGRWSDLAGRPSTPLDSSTPI